MYNLKSKNKLYLGEFTMLWILLVAGFVFPVVLAVIDITEENYKDLINCAGEVSKKVFKHGEALLVVFPIIEQSDRIFEYQTCLKVIPQEHFNNSHCLSIFHPSIMIKYSEIYCYVPPEYKISVRGQKVHDSILSKLHSFSKWPIMLNPIFPENEYHYSEISSYVTMLDFNQDEPQGIINEVNEMRRYFAQNELGGEGIYLMINTGDPLPSEFFIEEYLSPGVLESHMFIVVTTATSGNIKVFVYSHELQLYSLSVKSFSTTCITDGNNGSFEHGQNLDIFGYPDYLRLPCIEQQDLGLNGIYWNMGERVIREIDSNLSQIIHDFIVPRNDKLANKTHLCFRVLNSYMDPVNFHTGTKTFVYTLRASFFVHLADKYSRWNSIFRAFSTTTWIIIFTSIFICSFVFRLFCSSNYVMESGFRNNNYSYYLLNLWAILLGVGVTQMPRNHYIRILFISWVVYGLCINTVFQTFVTSYLIDPGFQHQVTTYEEISNNSFDIYVPSIQVFEKQLYNNSYSGFPFADALKYIVRNRNTALLVPQEVFIYGYTKICPNNPPTLYVLMDEAVDISVHYEFVDGLNTLNEVEVIMARLVESGIPEKIKQDVSDPKGTKEGLYRPKLLKEEYEPLKNLHLQSPFLIYLIGNFVSFAVFISEILVASIRPAIASLNIKFWGMMAKLNYLYYF